MKSNRILLLGGNYFPEPTGIGKYNGELMMELSSLGYECAVVTTYPYYPFWKVQQNYAHKSSWFSKEVVASDHALVKIYRCPHYVPQKPSSVKRILSDFSFFLSAFIQLFFLLFKKKYDVVITVVPPFQLGLLGLVYKWVKGAKLVYHIQDMQIDAAKELGMIRSNSMLKLMFGLEKFILKHSDYVSSISEGMIRKIESKCRNEVLFFPNWADTKFFYPLFQKDKLKKKFSFSANDKIILYSGAIGEKQGLEMLLDVAEMVKREDVKFVICGSGPYKETLIKIASQKKLNNVCFLPVQSKEDFNEFLNIADVHLVLQKSGANDLVMPSKLTTILSVGGLALITAPAGSSLFNLVAKHKVGIVIDPENKTALLSGILCAVANNHSEIELNARAFAEKYLAIDNIIGGFLEKISIPSNHKGNVVPLPAATHTEAAV